MRYLEIQTTRNTAWQPFRVEELNYLAKRLDGLDMGEATVILKNGVRVEQSML